MDIPRIVAVDLDNTLLRSGGTVSQRTVAALELARAAGAEVVAVTARPPRVLDEVLDGLPLAATAICSNGAVRYDLPSGRVTVTDPLAAATAAATVRRLRPVLPSAAYAVETGLRVLHEPAYPYRERGDAMVARMEVDAFWAETDPIAKLLVWTAEVTAEQALAGVRSALDTDVEVTHSGAATMLEISASGVTKASGLAGYCVGQGVSASQVVAFGDGLNDLPMLRWAGLGFAMANAHPLVLAGTAHHTAANDDDGVAMVLERLFGPSAH